MNPNDPRRPIHTMGTPDVLPPDESVRGGTDTVDATETTGRAYDSAATSATPAPAVSAATSLEQLKSLLRGEISAVETYRLALAKVVDPRLQTVLREALESHHQRVDRLRAWITQRGGTPPEDSGLWGSFAKLVETGAVAIGVRPGIAALEAGEDHGLRDYRNGLKKLDAGSCELVEQYLLPEQERTHRALSTLKHTLH
jgi:hypothetical protein